MAWHDDQFGTLITVALGSMAVGRRRRVFCLVNKRASGVRGLMLRWSSTTLPRKTKRSSVALNALNPGAFDAPCPH